MQELREFRQSGCRTPIAQISKRIYRKIQPVPNMKKSKTSAAVFLKISHLKTNLVLLESSLRVVDSQNISNQYLQDIRRNTSELQTLINQHYESDI